MGSVHVPPSHVQIVIGSFMINVPGILFIHFIYPLARLEIVTISMCATGISPLHPGDILTVLWSACRCALRRISPAWHAPRWSRWWKATSSDLLHHRCWILHRWWRHHVWCKRLGGGFGKKAQGEKKKFGVWRRLRIHVFGPIYLHLPYKSTKCRWIYHRWMA